MNRNVEPTRVIDVREFAGRMANRLQIPTREIMREIAGMVADLKNDPNTEDRIRDLSCDEENPEGLDAIASPAWREWMREMSLWKLVEMDLARLYHAKIDDPKAPHIRSEYAEDRIVAELREKLDERRNA